MVQHLGSVVRSTVVTFPLDPNMFASRGRHSAARQRFCCTGEPPAGGLLIKLLIKLLIIYKLGVISHI